MKNENNIQGTKFDKISLNECIDYIHKYFGEQNSTTKITKNRGQPNKKNSLDDKEYVYDIKEITSDEYEFYVTALYELSIRNPTRNQKIAQTVKLFNEHEEALIYFYENSFDTDTMHNILYATTKQDYKKLSNQYNLSIENIKLLKSASKIHEEIATNISEIKIFKVMEYNDILIDIYKRDYLAEAKLFKIISHLSRYFSKMGFISKFDDIHYRIDTNIDKSFLNEITSYKQIRFNIDGNTLISANLFFAKDKFYLELIQNTKIKGLKYYELIIFRARHQEVNKEKSFILEQLRDMIDCDMTLDYEKLNSIIGDYFIPDVVNRVIDFKKNSLPYIYYKNLRQYKLNKNTLLYLAGIKISDLNEMEPSYSLLQKKGAFDTKVFNKLKHLLNKKNKFIFDLFIYDSIALIYKNIRTNRLPNNTYEKLLNIFKKNWQKYYVDIESKTVQNRYLDFKNIIDNEYFEHI